MADEVKLLPCPWCGELPTIEYWHGGPKSKRMVHCENEGFWVNPKVCGNTPKQAADHWNTRAPAPREDGWRLIKTQPPTKADGLFLVFVPSCIMGCALVENGKIVWPREGESEQAHGVTHWRPLPAPPSAREG